jgi:hypothetical protein
VRTTQPKLIMEPTEMMDTTDLNLPNKIVDRATLATVVEHIGSRMLTTDQLHDEFHRFLHPGVFIKKTALFKISSQAFSRIVTNNYRTQSPLRFDRFVRRLKGMIASMTSTPPNLERARARFNPMLSYFNADDGKQLILTRDLLNVKLAQLVEMADGRIDQSWQMFQFIEAFTVYCESVHELSDDIPAESFEKMIGHLWLLRRNVNDDTKRTYIWKRISKLIRATGYCTTKEMLRREVYIDTVRAVTYNVGEQIFYRYKSRARFVDGDSLRFERLYRRILWFNETKENPCHRTMEMHYALRCYFDPMVGPTLDRKTLLAKFGRLRELTFDVTEPRPLKQRLTAIGECARELNDFLESVEEDANDVGIGPCAFEDLIEMSGILREIIDHRSYDLWDPIALQVNAMLAIVMTDNNDYPPGTIVSEVEDAAIAANAHKELLTCSELKELFSEMDTPVTMGPERLEILLNTLNERRYEKPKNLRYKRFVKRARALVDYLPLASESDLASYLDTMQYCFGPPGKTTERYTLLGYVSRMQSILIDSDQSATDMLVHVDRAIDLVESVDEIKDYPNDSFEQDIAELHCLRASLKLGLPKTVLWRHVKILWT